MWRVSDGIAIVLRKCSGSVGFLRIGDLLFLLLCGWSLIGQEFGGGGVCYRLRDRAAFFLELGIFWCFREIRNSEALSLAILEV